MLDSLDMKAMPNRTMWLLACSLLVLAGCRNSGSNQPVARGPMVQMVSPTGFSVVWTAPRDADQTFEATHTDSDEKLPTKIEADQTRRQIATVTEATPDSEITYRILDREKKTLAEYRVRTAPDPTADPPTEFSLIAFGDSGEGNEPQNQLAAQMEKFKPRLIVHTGDLVYPDGEASDYPLKFYQPYAEMLTAAPFYPSIGNHDYHSNQGGPLMDDFVLPRNGPEGQTPERHYWFDYGCVRFVALDSNLSKQEIDEHIVPWLDNVLSDTKPRWKIVFFHHPVWSNAHYGPTRKLWDRLVPCLEKHRVNLVLNGHDHLYERTHPLVAQEIVEPGNGVVYITTGAGGAKLYDPRSAPMPQIEVAIGGTYSFTVIDVGVDTLKIRQIDVSGKVIDEYAIPRWQQAVSTAKVDSLDDES